LKHDLPGIPCLGWFASCLAGHYLRSQLASKDGTLHASQELPQWLRHGATPLGSSLGHWAWEDV